MKSINPSTEKLIQEYAPMTLAKVDAIVQSVHNAYLGWREVSISKRAEKMYQLAEHLRKNKHTYATIITQEMGKPITASEAEIEKCALTCTYYADNTETFLQPRPVPTAWQKSYVSYQPLGVIFGIMPWNFPFWQVFRFIVPNLMAGHACLLKHANNVTGTALLIESIIREIGFPSDVFRTLILPSDKVSYVIQKAEIAAVTLTGSENAGRSVASEAGRHLKKVIVELGSNDPYIILEDADISKAAQICITARLNNAGQSCIAAKRLIIVESVLESFQDCLLHYLQDYHFGDPLDSQTRLGPLSRSDLRINVHEQVQQSVQQGAKLLRGGFIPERTGFYYPPTVLSHVMPGMVAFDEEIFGPVFALISAKNEEEAISLANHTRFGLSASVFSKNIKKAEYIAQKKIQAGTCGVNSLIASDPRLPFGGIKHSGFGKELGIEGLLAFMNVKTVVLNST